MVVGRRTGVGFLPSLVAGRRALRLASLTLAYKWMPPCAYSSPTSRVSRGQLGRPMPPLLCVDSCCAESSGYVDLSYCVPRGTLRSRLRASFVATFGVAVGLLHRCPYTLDRILE